MTLSTPPALTGQRLAVVDVEGNGQQPPEIIEIAVLPLADTTTAIAADIRTWLIRPTQPITPLVTRKVHGIGNRDVADSPLWTEVAEEISDAITGRVLVAHNASVERRVIATHLPRWRPPLVLDTLRLAKAVWPGLSGGYSLDRLITHADLTPPPTQPGQAGQRRHRAGYDTWMTAQLLITLAERSDYDWEELIDAARHPDLDAEDGNEVGLW